MEDIAGSILIVEDNALLAFGLKKKLEKSGYSISGIASSGEEALELAAAHNPDLILLDSILSGKMDEMGVSRRIQNSLNIPIVFLTQFSVENMPGRASITGASGYSLNPYNERELEIVVELAIHKKRMEKLKKSHNLLEIVLMSMKDAIIATDESGNVAFLNYAAEKMTGKSLDEVMGLAVEEVVDIIDENNVTSARSILNRVLSENATIISNRNSFLLTEKEKPIKYVAYPLIDDRKKVIGIVMIIEDLTTQQSMQIEPKMTEMVMASSINALCMTDSDGKINYFNSSLNKLLGCSPGDIAGRSLLALCKIEDRFSDIKNSLETNGTWAGELIATRKEGSSLHVQLEARRVTGNSSSMNYMFFLQDITELKRSRDELQRCMAKLHKTDVEAEKIADCMSMKIANASESINRLYDLFTNNLGGGTNERALELLINTKNAIDQIAMLQDQLIQSSLPLPLYICLAEFYRMKVDELATL